MGLIDIENMELPFMYCASVLTPEIRSREGSQPPQAGRKNDAVRVVELNGLQPAGSEGHRIQLDSVRAFAVLTVLVQHFMPFTERWVELGAIGVRVFFVLSGFLITGILLRARQHVEATGNSKWLALRSFYVRRILRIFPLFYVTLIVMELAGSRPVRESFWWHASYLSNFYFFLRGTGNNSVTHLWSLAVEEQFYLVWPFIILFSPRKYVLPAVILAVITGPLFRAVILLGGGNAWQASVLTPGCLDTLGLGALLATLSCQDDQHRKARFVTTALWIGLPLFVGVIIGSALHSSAMWVIPRDVGIGLGSVWLIDRAYVGFGGMTGRVLTFLPLAYLGMISYGIYVTHNFVGGFVTRLFTILRIQQASSITRLSLLFLMTIAVASASWYILERPINGLKRYFPYRAHENP